LLGTSGIAPAVNLPASGNFPLTLPLSSVCGGEGWGEGALCNPFLQRSGLSRGFRGSDPGGDDFCQVQHSHLTCLLILRTILNYGHAVRAGGEDFFYFVFLEELDARNRTLTKGLSRAILLKKLV
jgi:hypothetical protein